MLLRQVKCAPNFTWLSCAFLQQSMPRNLLKRCQTHFRKHLYLITTSGTVRSVCSIFTQWRGLGFYKCLGKTNVVVTCHQACSQLASISAADLTVQPFPQLPFWTKWDCCEGQYWPPVSHYTSRGWYPEAQWTSWWHIYRAVTSRQKPTVPSSYLSFLYSQRSNSFFAATLSPIPDSTLLSCVQKVFTARPSIYLGQRHPSIVTYWRDIFSGPLTIFLTSPGGQGKPFYNPPSLTPHLQPQWHSNIYWADISLAVYF